MSTEVAVVSNNLPATYEDEAEALLEGTESHETFLKFRKGKYFIRKDEVSLGFECIAHPYAYQLGWIKFENDKVTERIMGRKADRFVPPQREELSEPHDAWAFVHELPLEDEGGQVLCFTTSTKGGLIAIEQLIKAYWHRLKSRGSRALPIIKLATAEMSTKDYG